MPRLRHRPAHAAAILLTAAFATTACGLIDDASPSESAAPTTIPADATVITMAVWGGFGLDELIAEYEAENPGVVIQLETGDYNPMHATLQNDLVSGNGAPTIAAIGEDYIAKFAAQPEQFVDLGPLGGADYKDSYLPWKWAEATGPAGELVGLGADVAGLALCYRTDLFAAAGLPTDRLALAGAMDDSWAGFITLGKQYVEATGDPFIDNAGSLLSAMRSQQGTAYYDEAGVLNPTPVKPAFDLALSAIDGGLSAGVTEFSDEWDKGLTNGDFAVTLCPVWGMGYMQGVVDESNYEPKWDIADIPGEGGNWGGSFYTIPAQASPEERDAAWEFLRWLIQPAQQLKVFQATGSLPSQPSLYSDSSVTGYTIPFFNDAPVGTMLAKTVEELPVMTSKNPKNGTVEATMEQVLTEVQAGTITTTDAWAVALEAAKLVDGA